VTWKDRIFQLLGPNMTVEFQNLTIKGGDVPGGRPGPNLLPAQGGGLLIDGADVTLDHAIVTGNKVVGAPGGAGVNGVNGGGGSGAQNGGDAQGARHLPVGWQPDADHGHGQWQPSHRRRRRQGRQWSQRVGRLQRQCRGGRHVGQAGGQSGAGQAGAAGGDGTAGSTAAGPARVAMAGTVEQATAAAFT